MNPELEKIISNFLIKRIPEMLSEMVLTYNPTDNKKRGITLRVHAKDFVSDVKESLDFWFTEYGLPRDLIEELERFGYLK
jgi:hypothetical protein